MLATLPKTMKAVVIDRPGPPESMRVEVVPVPHPTRNHVVIALDYASVGIWDAEQRAGAYGKVEPGTIPGVDGSGHIAAVGSDVTDFKAGDRVYACRYGARLGFYAQFVSIPAEHVALVPEHLDQQVAGAIPCVALTAQSGLEALKISRGQELFVFGASGGVGSMAVWLGNQDGATITGTARHDVQPYVRELGAKHAIDPRDEDIARALKRASADGFDAALITANSPDLGEFLSHLRRGGPFAYPNGVEPAPQHPEHRGIAFDGEMSAAAFRRFNKTIGSHAIPIRIEEYLLEDVVRAHHRIEERHVVGKIVLRIQ
jgi:NADPH2:quinone reductase